MSTARGNRRHRGSMRLGTCGLADVCLYLERPDAEVWTGID
eukprot:SAG31_NODE_211_length_20274_cov_40.333482_17_plen_41_part_00